VTPRDRPATEQEKAAQQAGDDAAQAVRDETGVGNAPPSDPDQLREEIQKTREELGQTVEALAQKADVKTQVREQVEERKEQVKQRRVPIGAAAGALVAGFILLRLIRKR
jgi:uncharacterized protein DUF3618